MSLSLLLQIAADFSRERIDAALHQYVTHPELCTVAASPPAEPVRLWRGAPAEYLHGMSWTDDPGLADHFAREVAAYFSGGVPGQVWTAVVQPSELLAFSSQFTWRGAQVTEREYVVDTGGLVVTEWSG